MRLLHALNLAAGISCLVIGANIILFGSIKIVEPNLVIVAVEVAMAIMTISLNVREVVKHE